MGYESKIEWTDHTFNPWIGCAKVSQGCTHCYAETLMDARYGRVEWGVNGTRVRTSIANWRKPLQWNREAEKQGVRKRVFCASLADVFEQRKELRTWRLELFNLIRQTPSLDWLLLTKRPQYVIHAIHQARVDSRVSKDEESGILASWLWKWETGFSPTNIWLGTSVENQEAANERIPHLLRCPATVRFLSCEPLLGPVDLGNDEPCDHIRCTCREVGCWRALDWVIVGGESGPKARPCSLSWVREIVEQCKAADVPIFVKQMGANPTWSDYRTDQKYCLSGNIRDSKGGDWSLWPEDLRVRGYPRPVEVAQ